MTSAFCHPLPTSKPLYPPPVTALPDLAPQSDAQAQTAFRVEPGSPDRTSGSPDRTADGRSLTPQETSCGKHLQCLYPHATIGRVGIIARAIAVICPQSAICGSSASRSYSDFCFSGRARNSCKRWATPVYITITHRFSPPVGGASVFGGTCGRWICRRRCGVSGARE